MTYRCIFNELDVRELRTWNIARFFDRHCKSNSWCQLFDLLLLSYRRYASNQLDTSRLRHFKNIWSKNNIGHIRFYTYKTVHGLQTTLPLSLAGQRPGKLCACAMTLTGGYSQSLISKDNSSMNSCWTYFELFLSAIPSKISRYSFIILSGIIKSEIYDHTVTIIYICNV